MTQESNKRNQRLIVIVLAILGTIIAIWLRFYLRWHTTNDYLCCFELWYDYIRQDGHYAFINAFSNLSMPILYFWYLISLIAPDLPTLFAVKIPAILCDFILAYFFYRLVSLKYSNPFVRLVAYIIPLFTPTVFLNSAWWGQFDSCYVAPVIAGIYYLLKKKEIPAFLLFGLAFSIKFQMIFILPFLIILLLRKVVNWKSFLLIPGIYLVSILPAWLRGRPLIDLLMIYPDQAGQYQRLCMNAPTVYSWISDNNFNLLYPLGIIVTAILTLLFIYFACKTDTLAQFEPVSVTHLALVSTLILPTLLPMMQGRYYYMAEIIALALAFYLPRLYFAPLVLQGLALYTYGRYFFGYDTPGFGLKVGSIILLLLLGYLTYSYFSGVTNRLPSNVKQHPD